MSDLASRVPIPVIVAERDGTVVRANDPARKFFGSSVDPGASLEGALLDRDTDTFTELLETSDVDTVPIQFDFDDHIRRCDVTASVVDDCVELVVDTTDREQWYEELLESIRDPIYMLDPDGVIQMVNDAFAEEYGWTKADIVGSDVDEFVPTDAVERGEAQIRRLLATDEANASMEFQATDADGNDRWTEVKISILRDDDGRFTGTVGVFRDITDRKARERDLAFFKTIAETAPVGIFTVDEQGTLTWANRRLYERFEMDQAELIDRPFLELVREEYIEPEMLERYGDYVRELLTGSNNIERVQHEEVLHPPPEDEPIIVDAYTALLPLNEDDRFTGTVNAFRDITQRKAYREALERQNERLEAFASLVSHDLRNPLNIASGYLDIAAERYPDDDALEEVEYAIERMNELVEDLLTLAREGDSVGETQVTSLADVAESAWSTVDTNDATLDVRTSAVVECDETRLRQVFENLFRNSIEHGITESAGNADSAGGATAAITVTVGETEDGFFVADDGVGLPTDIDLFEVGATTDEDGTGLGLAIVEEIVTAHGWEIESGESDDGGARFDVTGVTLASEMDEFEAVDASESE